MTRDAMRSPRFETLARICGLADADHARGKMLRLWDACTEEQTYVLPVDDVVSVLGEHAIDGLERSRLGELVAGGVRIKGTVGRIEWLGDKRQQASAAGQARVAGAKRDALGRLMPSSGSSGYPAGAGVAGPADTSARPAASSPPTPTPTPTPGSDQKILSGVAPARQPRKARVHPPSDPADDPKPSERDAAYAVARGVDIATEWPAMFDNHRKRAEPSADWSASWRTWCGNAVKFREERHARTVPPAQQRLTGAAAGFDLVMKRERAEREAAAAAKGTT